MAAHYELRSTANNQFLFHLKAPNGEIILSSEIYSSKKAALEGIESVRRNAPLDQQFERKVSRHFQPYFLLKANNHEIIGRSEMYTSDGAMEKGIQSVKKNGPIATTNDFTIQGKQDAVHLPSCYSLGTKQEARHRIIHAGNPDTPARRP
jgi:uncharacterized protein YegP (UPF0339 family)